MEGKKQVSDATQPGRYRRSQLYLRAHMEAVYSQEKSSNWLLESVSWMEENWPGNQYSMHVQQINLRSSKMSFSMPNADI